MLAKKTAKNQITLPKAILGRVAESEYFEVSESNGRIVLTPVQINNAHAVRDKLNSMGITDSDVADAVDWARKE